jgi:hypothetical protein
MNNGKGIIKKETLDPGTAAEDGRRKIRAYIDEHRPFSEKNQADFYTKVISCLSIERMGSFGDIVCESKTVLARYLLNIALCESLYSSLQFCEVALRNAIHSDLTNRYGSGNWFDSPNFTLTPWATTEIAKAKEKINKSRKQRTPGKIVAELQFGFWTSFFEDHYERNTSFMPGGIKTVFPYLPKSQHNRKDIKAKLETIRTLRNRVFHHERIVHWKNLDSQHQVILDVLSWINPELLHLAEYLDTFVSIRSAGLGPWLHRLDDHWNDLLLSEIHSKDTSHD